MTIELFIILSILGTSIIGGLNLSIAYLSFRLLSLNKAILQETITIRKDTEVIKDENIRIRKLSTEVRDKI